MAILVKKAGCRWRKPPAMRSGCSGWKCATRETRCGTRAAHARVHAGLRGPRWSAPRRGPWEAPRRRRPDSIQRRRAIAQRTEFYEELDIDMDDPDAPWPNGCYEDLEGYTHKAEAWAVHAALEQGYARAPEESEDDEEEDKFIRSLEPKEVRYRDAEDIAAMMLDAGDDYDSVRKRRFVFLSLLAPTFAAAAKSPEAFVQRSAVAAPPQPTEAEDDEYRHLSPLFVPPRTEGRGGGRGAASEASGWTLRGVTRDARQDAPEVFPGGGPGNCRRGVRLRG